MIPTDPLFDRQRHLSNDTGLDLHILQAWDDYSGAGVRVAVMDDGVQGSHPDLDGNYRFDLDFDARDNDKDAAPVDLGLGTVGDNHGTPVAGVIGMDANNGVGGVGVAWGCDLTGLRFGHGSEGGLQQQEACFARFNRFDVVNNSWQNPNAYLYNFEDPSLSNLSNELVYAVQNGRGRLGTNIVFISSNFREDGFDTNFSNLTNSRFITTVAAINFDGAYSSYSTPGESILVSAFGTEGTSIDDGIVTTDRTGDAGHFETDYLFDSGTSYAAPQVSGVVALMLEANPGLGYRDVQNILAYSARMVNPSYVNDQTGEAGWRFNTSAQWNGGGLHFSRDYGFGLVDATAAVRLAEHWTAQSTYASGEVGSFDGAGGLVIRDHRTITTDITAPSDLRLETVEVLANITHSHLGDLKVELIGPSGQVSLLAPANPSVGEDQDELHFRYTARRHLDEDAGGTWTLRITDNADDNQGVLNNWTLVLNGDTDNDDIYVFTDEYGSRTTAPGARNLVSDGDSGADTLNAAAVPTASRIDLSGGASRIDGRALTIADRTIENAIGGDGGDTVIGNTLKNHLLGVRGDDFLDGKKGNDRLEGSEGNDWLYGRLGHDLLRGGSGRDRLSGGDGHDRKDHLAAARALVPARRGALEPDARRHDGAHHRPRAGAAAVGRAARALPAHLRRRLWEDGRT